MPPVPPPAPTEIFRSSELLVKDLRRHASPYCVVTFESYTDNRTLDRPGFGEVFFDANGIDAIHIVPCNNDWYQYPEIDEACRRVRELTTTYAEHGRLWRDPAGRPRRRAYGAGHLAAILH